MLSPHGWRDSDDDRQGWRDYRAGWRDGMRDAATELDQLADALTNRGDSYKAALVERCVRVVRMSRRRPPWV